MLSVLSMNSSVSSPLLSPDFLSLLQTVVSTGGGATGGAAVGVGTGAAGGGVGAGTGLATAGTGLGQSRYINKELKRAGVKSVFFFKKKIESTQRHILIEVFSRLKRM